MCPYTFLSNAISLECVPVFPFATKNTVVRVLWCLIREQMTLINQYF